MAETRNKRKKKKEKLTLTQKIRIFPTAEQEEVLWKLSERCRLIYNFALAERKEAWKKGIKGITYRKQQNDLPQLKEKYPEYNWVYSKVLQSVLRGLTANYRSFFALRRNGHKDSRPPKFKGKNHFTTMVYNQSGFKIENKRIRLSHFYNDVTLEFAIPEKFTFDDKKVIQVAISSQRNRYFVTITYEEDEKPYVDNGKYQAIDLGVSNLVTAVNSEGKFLVIKNQRPDKYWDPKISKLKSRRDKCIKYSRRWKHLDKIVKKYQEKCAKQRRDFQHKLSKKLVENTKANTIIVGKLEIQNMPHSTKEPKFLRKGLNRGVYNGAMGQFVQFLTYKSRRVGKRIIEFDERNSTKECWVCGKLHYMPIWKRIMSCECGNVIERDKNSAIILMKRYLSHNALWTGYRKFLDKLRHTAKDKTKVPQLVFEQGSEDSQEASLFNRVGSSHFNVLYTKEDVSKEATN